MEVIEKRLGRDVGCVVVDYLSFRDLREFEYEGKDVAKRACEEYIRIDRVREARWLDELAPGPNQFSNYYSPDCLAFSTIWRSHSESRHSFITCVMTVRNAPGSDTICNYGRHYFYSVSCFFPHNTIHLKFRHHINAITQDDR